MKMAEPIYLFSDINSETSEKIVRQINDIPKNEAIELWINSPGGSVSAGWAIIAALSNRTNVNMTVLGDANSMAFIMLLFADNVTSYDTSNFLIHRAASFWEEMMTKDELKEIENRNNLIRKKLEKRIDAEKFKSVTGNTFDDIFNMEDRLDVFITANQAKKIGLVDKVTRINPKKKREIESRFISEIAANSNININVKPKNMSIADRIFGSGKDKAYIAKIGDIDAVYSKLEQGAEVKPIGDVESVSGTFETEDKRITVVKNEITAVEQIDKRAAEIQALKAEIKELRANQVSEKDIVDVMAKFKTEFEAEIKGVKDTLEAAKLTKSNPTLPVGEFEDEIGTPKDNLTTRERIVLQQNASAEAKRRTKEGRNV